MRIKLYVACPQENFEEVDVKTCIECPFCVGITTHTFGCEIECDLEICIPAEDWPELLRPLAKYQPSPIENFRLLPFDKKLINLLKDTKTRQEKSEQEKDPFKEWKEVNEP